MGSIRDRANMSTKGPVERSKDYYDLKMKAVADLADADESNSPEVSDEEINKYKSRAGKLHVSNTIKVLFVKFWFAAALCYFFIWGLSNYLKDQLDLLFVSALAFGMMTDILTNNAIRFFAEELGSNDKWMMFPKKKYITFFLNIIYSFLVIFIVYQIYTMINYAFAQITGNHERVVLGVEPILFGVFCVITDLTLIKIKRVFLGIIEDAKKKAGNSGK